MAFDPDAYLASQDSFDPDAYLNTKKSAKPEPKDMSWSQVGRSAIVHAPGSLITKGADIISGVINPKTWSDAAATAFGGIASIPGVKQGLVALGEKPEAVEQAKVPFQQFVEFKKQQYGSVPRLKQTIAEDPMAPVIDALSVGLPLKPSMVAKASPGNLYAQALRKGGEAIEASTAPKLAAKKAVNATRDATIKQSMEAGYTIPRSRYNPSQTTSALESIGGKEAISQEAAQRNQMVTDSLARKYLNIPEDTAFSEQLIDDLLKSRAEPYREAASLPSVRTESTAGGLVKAGQTRAGDVIVKEIKETRDIARNNWKAFNRGEGKPTEALEAAQKADAQVAKLETELEDLAQRNNKPELLDALRQSRKELAKIHTIDKAMNPATGEINATNIKQQYNKNVPLTDEAKLIADFANSFQKESRLGSSVPSPDVSKLNAILAGGGAGAGGLIGGVPGSIIGGLTAYGAPIAARGAALSKMLQKLPSYEQNMVVKMMKASPKANPLALALYELNNQGEQ